MYAVIELKGHQYFVQKGDQIIVDNIGQDIWKTADCEEVLLVFSEDKKTIAVWTPVVKWAKVTYKVIETKKGKKVEVLKFKRKNRYQRKLWFRPLQSTLEIKKIVFDG